MTDLGLKILVEFISEGGSRNALFVWRRTNCGNCGNFENILKYVSGFF